MLHLGGHELGPQQGTLNSESKDMTPQHLSSTKQTEVKCSCLTCCRVSFWFPSALDDNGEEEVEEEPWGVIKGTAELLK